MKDSSSKKTFAFGSLGEAVAAMCERLEPVASETIPLCDCAGRVLAQAVEADRASPACDVSAMDGYAVRMGDLAAGSLAVVGEAAMGRPPASMPDGAVMCIFTGAPVPAECEAVIPREQVVEHPDRIELPAGLEVAEGQHIRRRGENGGAGEEVVGAGAAINSPIASALAAFGVVNPFVYQRVRLGVIVTGNEIAGVGEAVKAWQLRDSNGPALAAMFSASAWIDLRFVRHAPDDAGRLKDVIGRALAETDALLLSGGVSMGDYDFVPGVLAELGCEIVFHKLPIRPGKPVLGAVGPGGQVVMGLPGNPVSVMTTARRIAGPILRHVAGHAVVDPPVMLARVRNADEKRIGMQWCRPVRLCGGGEVELIATRGSGDILSAARSDGVVEIPPNQSGPGPWPFYSWSLRDG